MTTESKTPVTWSVKGVSEAARTMTKHAAASRGMAMGEWIATVILDEARTWFEAHPRDKLTADDQAVYDELAALFRQLQTATDKPSAAATDEEAV